MINFSKLTLRAFVSSFCGIVLSLLVGMYITINQGFFWFLLILIWLIIAGINGYIVKSKFEPLIFSAFVLIFWIVTIFSFSLLLVGFSTSVLDAIHIGSDLFDQLSIVKTSLLVTVITSSILFVILNLGSYCLFLIKYFVNKAKPKTIEILEQEAYATYENPSDSGTYMQRTDDYDE
ncbi:MAG: hypothetical protein FK733_03150 [Asgard group archaeon]|nr:hypothetical protein [Asgard group archaeon]